MLCMNLINILIILSSFAASFARLFPIHAKRNLIVQCILSIAEDHFEVGTTIGVAANDSTSNSIDVVLENLMAGSKWSFTVRSHQSGHINDGQIIFHQRVRNYIWIMTSPNAFRSVLNRWLNLNSWNPRAKFVIAMDSAYCDWRSIVDSMKKELLRHFMMKVIILVPCDELYHYIRVCTTMYEIQFVGSAKMNTYLSR